MRFYVASRFQRIEEMQDYKGILEGMGHEVTSRWMVPGHQGGKSTPEVRRIRGIEDFEDVRAAQALIAFTGDAAPDGSGRTFGGYHTEIGLAIAWAKPIALVGDRLNVFHFIPGIAQFDESWNLIEAIQAKRWPVHDYDDLPAPVWYPADE